jgi:DNA-binding MarR family transcriptional regulator
VELSRLLVSVAYRSLEASGQSLPLPQFRALTVLARYGPCTAGGLAEALDQVASTVTRMCDRLVAAGYVTRQNRPDNRREVEVAITEQGRQLVEQVLAARAAEFELVLGRMRPADRTALAKVLPGLLAAADDHLPDSRARWAV